MRLRPSAPTPKWNGPTSSAGCGGKYKNCPEDKREVFRLIYDRPSRLASGELRFSFAEPEGLTLARPVPHPWAPGRQVGTVGAPVALPAGTEFDPIRGCYEDLVEANARLQRVVDSEAPEALVGPAVALSGARGNQQQLIQYVGGGLIYRGRW